MSIKINTGAFKVRNDDGSYSDIIPSLGGNNVVVDPSLTIAGNAADAKKVGDEITSLKDELETLESKIPTGGGSGGTGGSITVDSALSSTSTNPVQNKIIKQAIDNLDNVLKIDVPSKNLLNVTWEYARLLEDGSFYPFPNANANISHQEYIPVESGENYTFSSKPCLYNQWLYVDEYDRGKTFIKSTTLRYTKGYEKASILVGSATSFVRIMLYDSENVKPSLNEYVPVDFQMEKGTVSTEYVVAGYTKEYITEDNGSKAFLEKMKQASNDLNSVPSHYLANGYLDKKANRINELIEESASNGDAFFFITDEHWTINQKHSPALINYLSKKCNIPRLFSGGDTADKGSKEFCDMIRDNFNGEIHHVVGNHDLFYPTTGDMLYAWMDIHNTNQIGNNQRHYYYVDNPQQKLRYIILNGFYESDGSTSVMVGYGQDQIDWFRDDALSLPNGYDCLVFDHYVSKMTTTKNEITNIVDAYDGDGEILAIIQGHMHYDFVTTTEGGTPIICTTCDKNIPYVGGGLDETPILGDRTSGTIKEQAFDVMILDRKQRKITAVRIGCPCREGYDSSLWSNSEERTVYLKDETMDDYDYINGVSSDGVAYIDTGIVMKQNDGIEVDFKTNENSAKGNNMSIFGARDANNVNSLTLFQYSYSDTTYVYGSQHGNNVKGYWKTSDFGSDKPSVLGQRSIFRTGKTGTELTIGEIKKTLAHRCPDMNYSMALFGLNEGGTFTNINKCTIYGCTITRDGATIMELVPVRKKSTGEAGFFDNISKTFFGNSNSTGTLTAV